MLHRILTNKGQLSFQKRPRNFGKRNKEKNQEMRLMWNLRKETVKEKVVVIHATCEDRFRKQLEKR